MTAKNDKIQSVYEAPLSGGRTIKISYVNNGTYVIDFMFKEHTKTVSISEEAIETLIELVQLHEIEQNLEGVMP